MAGTTSASSNYAVTRDDIIKRALRIIGAIGQGETPSSTAYTESAQALNDIMKEWNADGMQLWKYKTLNAITLTASTNSYTIGISATGSNQQAPLKITQAWLRKTSDSTDLPILVITKQEYDILSSKSSTGTPSQLYYKPPGTVTTEQVGTIYLYTAPDSTAASAYTLYVVGMLSIEDFDASTDVADFPSYYYNAVVWTLADQLAYEYGLPYAERSMITKKAEVHKANAMSFDIEEGSLYLMPDWQGQTGSR